MKKIYISIFVLITIGLISCDKYERYFCRSYVYSYNSYNDIELKNIDSTNFLNESFVGLEEIFLKNIDSVNVVAIVATNIKEICNMHSKGKQAIIYDSLCVLHKDMSYNRKERSLDSPIWSGAHFALSPDLANINIISDMDFDEFHKAGDKLNDIINLLSFSTAPFIRSGYVSLYHADTSNSEYYYYAILSLSRNRAFPIKKSLSEITISDMELMGGGFNWYLEHNTPIAYLFFTQEPTISKTHNLTVTITLSDGRFFEKNIEKTFN
ncbi:hypothetical protein FACS1894153_4750 [Bacteroidia bacterium]|nr:hypothetical protein FACS1894153_4750 [Bacteroidia bacterium]